MKVLFASTSNLAIPSIELVQEANHQLLGLLTKADSTAGRGKKITSNELVKSLGDTIPVFKVANHVELKEVLHEIHPDLVVTISFGMIVRSESLSIPKHGWVNLHFSLLPAYRGAAPIQRAIMAGERTSGITVFKLDEGMDTGPIYLQKEFNIADLNAGECLEGMSRIGAQAVTETLKMISEGIRPCAQSGVASVAPKLSAEEMRIDFTKDAQSVLRQIRALAPKPGAWCLFRGNRVKILAGKYVEGVVEGMPGQISSTVPVTVALNSGALEVERIQEAGKRALSGAEWARGKRLLAGECFE